MRVAHPQLLGVSSARAAAPPSAVSIAASNTAPLTARNRPASPMRFLSPSRRSRAAPGRARAHLSRSPPTHRNLQTGVVVPPASYLLLPPLGCAPMRSAFEALAQLREPDRLPAGRGL